VPTFIYGSDYPTKDGTCERDYVDVRDLITAIKKCVEILPNKEIGTLNLGTGNPHTVLDVVKSIEKRIGKIEIRFGDARLGDPSSVIADIAEAALALDWRPVYDLDSSVNSMTSHLKPH
jgi:UDP-glucose 4-epimerase